MPRLARIFTVTGAEVSEYPSESGLCYHLEPDGDEGPQEGDRLVLVSEAREELIRELAAIWRRIPPIRHQVDAAMVFSAGEDIRGLINRLFPGGER